MKDISGNPRPLRWGPGIAAPEDVQEQKRKAIVQAAAGIFNEWGYHGTSLADVAGRLGVTKQAIYYYFKDKQALLFACSLVAHQSALALLPAVLEESGSRGRDQLARFLERYAKHVVDGNLQFVMFVHSTEFSQEQLEQIVACRTSFDAGVRALIEEGIADGSLAACDVKFASLTLLGAVNWIARWYRHGGPLSLEAVAEKVVELALSGIDATPMVSLGRAPRS